MGGQLVHSIPEWKTSIERWFPRNDPVDERYFVRTVTRPIAWLYAGFTLLALVSLGALLAMCASSLLTSGFRGVGFNTALLAVWLATYCGFFTFWDPSNPDFWVVQVFLTPLLVVAVLARIPPNGLETSLLLVLAVSLLVVNGLGTVRLARDPANDYYTVYLRSVARELRSGDVLILGDHWPIRAHLDRHSIATLFLSVEISRTGAVDLAGQVRLLMESGTRVFVAPDIMEVSRVTQASYGPRYVRYVQELRGHLCGLREPIGGPDEMTLREVTCFDGMAASNAGSQ